MSTVFPFVAIPQELQAIFGEPDPGTRMYRREGPSEESGPWFDALTDLLGKTVSPGGASMYCPVSRAAVHKRLQEGKLSIFLFHVTHQKLGFFGGTKVKRDSPYGYIPVSELLA